MERRELDWLSMDRWRTVRVCRISKQGLYVDRIETIGPMAELAGHGHGPLLPHDVPYFLRANCPQQARDATLAAAALKLYRRAAKQSHVVSGKAPYQQLLDRTLQQLIGTQALDAPLSVLPDLLHVRLVRGAGNLLHQHPRATLLVGGQQDARRKLLRGREVRLEGIRKRQAAERHDALVAHAFLVRFDCHGEAAVGADELPEDSPMLGLRGDAVHHAVIEARDGA